VPLLHTSILRDGIAPTGYSIRVSKSDRGRYPA
jgi:hypothetical protein